MLFNSIQYLIFLPIVVGLYWALPRLARPVLLLIASYFFYMSWMKAYGLLLFGLTLWNYVVALLLVRTRAHKRLLFIAAVTGNLACLALYKYTNFIIDCIWSLLSFGHKNFNLPANSIGDAPVLPIVLPLAISFFVFEFIHYLVDVYKGSQPIKNPIRFGLFAAFFPSQIAGPIKRFQDFDEQVVESRPFDKTLFGEGISLIFEGMFKKVVLGDNLAQLVQPGFAHAASMGTLDAWVCVSAFTLQIYYDFSGYTDIGRGSAMLFGYRLPENFNMPYIARNLSDFWHRWHISLSTWLRDYLYIPLGGSKAGRWKQARNLCITMLLGGLWHGASWHYVVWGAFHGVGLVVTHTWQRVCGNLPAVEQLRKSLAWDACGRVFTLWLVMMGWVVFRADDMTQAGEVYRALYTLNSSTMSSDSVTAIFWQTTLPVALTLYVGYHATTRLITWWQANNPAMPALSFRPPLVARIVLACGLTLLIVGFAPHKAIPFIYFQF
ncbi:MAG: hypothetical protein K2Z81_27520 [Cyanobacteria bacterium]|nr:hypothetical protein [Cyanobacteriota bacterium]